MGLSAQQIIMEILLGKPFLNRNWAQYHTIKAGLVAKVYACQKIRLKSGQGNTEHRNTAKIDKFDKTMLKIAELIKKRLSMFGNTTILELKTTNT